MQSNYWPPAQNQTLQGKDDHSALEVLDIQVGEKKGALSHLYIILFFFSFLKKIEIYAGIFFTKNFTKLDIKK